MKLPFVSTALLTAIVLMSFLALPLGAQTLANPLPEHFIGVGLGFQNSAGPTISQKASGWYDSCLLALSSTYACLATDWSNGTTSNRAEVHQLFKQFGACGVFGTAGAGAATGALGGVGGTFDLGGVVACEIPEKFFKVKNLVGVFSGSWNKRNVVEAPDIGSALRGFGDKSVFRFGVGKTW